MTRKVPRHENFFCANAWTENLFPRAASFELRHRPHGAKFRDQCVAVLLQIIHQFRRRRLIEKLIGDHAPVARVGNHADLIFDLHHNHGMVAAVHFAQVAHQGRERARVGSEVFLAKRRKDLHAVTCFVLGARETLLIGLHPGRRVAGHAVLPGGEPQRHKTKLMPASFLY